MQHEVEVIVDPLRAAWVPAGAFTLEYVKSLRRRFRGPAVSVLLHGSAVLLLVTSAHYAPRPVTARMPGTAQGKRLMLTYSLGGKPAALPAPSKFEPPAPLKSTPIAAAVHAPVSAAVPAADQGLGTGGESSMGQGNINIATVQQHPRPQPDLSALARGAGGQVIMDVVIDEHGRISQLTLVRGLGGSIDLTVLATVREWTFNPATRDGKPISSEQEILLYYERGA